MTRIPDFAHHCKEVMLFIGIKMIHIASVRVEGLGYANHLHARLYCFFAFKMKSVNVRVIVNDVHQVRSFPLEPDIDRAVDLK